MKSSITKEKRNGSFNSAFLSFQSVSEALEVNVGQYVQVMDNKAFKSPFQDTSYLQIMNAELIDIDTVEVTFELFLASRDKEVLVLVDPNFKTIFTATYPRSLKSLAAVPGIRLLP